MPELRVRPYPLEGEALQSYICRLAKVNTYSYQKLSEFYNDEAAPLRSYTVDDRVKIISLTQELCGKVDIKNLIDIWSYYESDKELFDFSRIKLCPCCFKLDKNSVNAKYWLKHIVTCEIHEKLLIDQCTTCDADITLHSLATEHCIKCNTLISEMTTHHAICDGFSTRLNKAFMSVYTPVLFSNQLRNTCYPVLNQLKVVLLLVKIPNLSAEKYWKKRRKLTIEELHVYQTEGYKYISGEISITDGIKAYIRSAYAEGQKDLPSVLSRFTRLEGTVGTEFFFDELKGAIYELAKECPEYRLGISWLERLYQIDETLLDSFIYLNHFDLYLTGSKQSVALESFPLIINNFKSKLMNN
jgi:hypothetical protein